MAPAIKILEAVVIAIAGLVALVIVVALVFSDDLRFLFKQIGCLVVCLFGVYLGLRLFFVDGELAGGVGLLVAILSFIAALAVWLWIKTTGGPRKAASIATNIRRARIAFAREA